MNRRRVGAYEIKRLVRLRLQTALVHGSRYDSLTDKEIPLVHGQHTMSPVTITIFVNGFGAHVFRLRVIVSYTYNRHKLEYFNWSTD